MSAVDDLPPPLEDMSDRIVVKKTRKPTTSSELSANAKRDAKAATPAVTPKTDTAASQAETSKSPISTVKEQALPKASTVKVEGSKTNTGETSKKQPQMEEIKRNTAESTDPLRIPEVQEAMKSAFANTSSWLNDDLLKNFVSNPALASGLSNPKVMQAMNEIAKDPKAAFKYSNDPVVSVFLQNYMKVMGGHMSKLAETSDQTTQKEQPKTKPTSVDPMQSVDPAKLQRWMSNPEIRDILNDPWTSAALSDLQQNPSKFPYYIRARPIQILVKAGILRVPPAYQ